MKLQADVLPRRAFQRSQGSWVAPMQGCQSNTQVCVGAALQAPLLRADAGTETLLIDGLPASCPQEHAGPIGWLFFFFFRSFLLQANKSCQKERRHLTNSEIMMPSAALPPRLKTVSKRTSEV